MTLPSDADLEFWLVGVSNPQKLMQRRNRIWRSIVWDPVAHTGIEGCATLTELRAITLETLCSLLMSDEEFRQNMEQTLKPKGSSWTGSQAIRGYWKRQRQPNLPGLN